MERLSDSQLMVLLSCLQEKRGAFLNRIAQQLSDSVYSLLSGHNYHITYLLEQIDDWSGEWVNFDSARLVRLCTMSF